MIENKRISILGATGSIGTQTIDVLQDAGDHQPQCALARAAGARVAA